MKVRIGEREYEFDSVAEAIEFEKEMNKKEDISVKSGDQKIKQRHQTNEHRRNIGKAVKRAYRQKMVKTNGLDVAKLRKAIRNSPKPIGISNALDICGYVISSANIRQAQKLVLNNMNGIKALKGNKRIKFISKRMKRVSIRKNGFRSPYNKFLSKKLKEYGNMDRKEAFAKAVKEWRMEKKKEIYQG